MYIQRADHKKYLKRLTVLTRWTILDLEYGDNTERLIKSSIVPVVATVFDEEIKTIYGVKRKFRAKYFIFYRMAEVGFEVVKKKNRIVLHTQGSKGFH